MGSPSSADKTGTATLTFYGTTYDLPLPCTLSFTTLTTSPDFLSSINSASLKAYVSHDLCGISIASISNPAKSETSIATTSQIQATGPTSTSPGLTGTPNSTPSNGFSPHSSSPASTATNPAATQSPHSVTISIDTPSANVSLPCTSGKAGTSCAGQSYQAIASARSPRVVTSSVTTATRGVSFASSTADSHHANTDTAAIVGGVVGGFLCAFLLLSGGLLWFRRRQRAHKTAPSAEFMGIIGTITPEPFANQFTLIRDASEEPLPPSFSQGLCSDEMFEKLQGVGDHKEPLQEEDGDESGSINGSVDDSDSARETLHSTFSRSEDHVGVAV